MLNLANTNSNEILKLPKVVGYLNSFSYLSKNLNKNIWLFHNLMMCLKCEIMAKSVHLHQKAQFEAIGHDGFLGELKYIYATNKNSMEVDIVPA